MEKKPLKLQDGYIKEFSTSDTLPVQEQINQHRNLFRLLLLDLLEQGWNFKNDELIKEINYL